MPQDDAAAPGPATTAAPVAARPPSLLEAALVWLKIGVLGFGGPAGQIAMMHRLVIDEKRWIDEPRFLHALNFCMLLPGPEAQQLSVYLGWMLHGRWGGLVAGTLFVLPGALVMLTLSIVYVLWHDLPAVEGLLWGIKAAVLAVVIEATLRIGRRALRHAALYAIAALAFIGIFFFAVPFPLIILAAALLGVVAATHRPEIFAAGTGQSPGLLAPAPAPVPLAEVAAGRYRRGALAQARPTIAIGLALWAAPVVAVGFAFGWSSTFVDIGVFFAKMAVVTFGGAYAVLSYVAQQAVDGYGWLSAGEMLTGLGLAETTPGPLIMVVQFVAFLGAWRNPAGLEPMTAAVIGGLLATWVTFVPCFLWIFLGGPYVERLRGARRLSGALTAITAAVVGVILNLALWFGLHVLFAEVDERWIGPLRLFVPQAASIDGPAAALAGAAMLAMLGLRVGLLPVLATAGAIGVLLRL